MTILSSIEYMGILQYFSDAFTEYEVGVVVHKNHIFASMDSITIQDLESVPLAMMSSGFSMGNEFEKCFEELGVNYNVVFQNENWEVMVEHVSTYRSVALLPYPIRNLSHRDDIVWKPLRDEKVGRFNLFLVTSLDLKNQENKLLYDRYYENLISTQSL